MDNSAETPREYLPVHPELKVHNIQEFYSVPKSYLIFLEQDMQTYGNFVQFLRTIHCENNDLDSVLLRMETRVDNVWNRYLNYIREGASQSRIIQLRDINRKIWYAATMLCTFLTANRTLQYKVYLRRMEFILEDMDDVADSMKGDGGSSFDAWQTRFILRIHKIV
jgi:hypothetical protein